MRADPGSGVLAGLRVLDLAHHYSGALASTLLADLGATVVTVEHPSGNALRNVIPSRDGQSTWTSVAERNKRNITLSLSTEEGRQLLVELARDCDVIIENFRPGTLEKWGLGPDDLERHGLSLVLVRISGYGQTGPRRDRPGFGGAAEAFSGLTRQTGPAGGSPLLLSTAIADGVAGTFAALGALASCWNRLAARVHGGPAAGVEVVDIGLFEGLFRLIPSQLTEYSAFGTVPTNDGSKNLDHGLIRGVFRTADDVLIAVSAVGSRAVQRLLTAIADPGLIEDFSVELFRGPALLDLIERSQAATEAWIAGRPWSEVEATLRTNDVVFERVLDVADIATDPHYRSRGDVITVDDPVLGAVLQQGVVPKFSHHAHVVRHGGAPLGADNDAILGPLQARSDPTGAGG